MKKMIIAIVTTALMLSTAPAVMATGAMIPSAESKPAPTVVKPESSNPDAVAVLKDSTGKELVAITPEKIKVTAVSDVEKIADPVAKKEMKEAVTEIKNAKKVADIIPEIAEIVKEYTSIKKADDLAIMDVTHVEISDDVKEALKANPGATVDLIFDLNVLANEEIIVMHKTAKGWVALPKANVINNGDGTILAKFDGFSPVAFMKSTATVTAPKTGVDSYAVQYSFIAAGFLAICAVAFAVSKKAKTESK